MFFRKSPEQQIQEQLIKVKFLINTLNKNSEKSKAKEKQFQKKAKKALAINDEDTAKVYAKQAVQHRAMALKLLNLACRMDIMESQVKTYVATNKISENVGNVLNDLTQLCSPNMTFGNINEFEARMNDVTVVTNYTATILDGATIDGYSGKDEDALLELARDSLDLEMQSSLSLNFPVVTNISNQVYTPKDADLF